MSYACSPGPAKFSTFLVAFIPRRKAYLCLALPRFSVYRAFTAPFLHGGVLHVLFNLLAFVSLAPTLERQCGVLAGGMGRRSAQRACFEDMPQFFFVLLWGSGLLRRHSLE